MSSKYINSHYGSKFLAENGFSDIDFLCDVENLAARRCFSPNLAIFSLRVRSFGYITTSGSKSDVIFEFSTLVSLSRRCHFRRTTKFSATSVTIMSAHAQ